MKTKFNVLALLGAVVFLTASFAFRPVAAKKVIVIDAGHGGKDFGADMYGLQEKTIVSAIAQKIKAQNKNENVEIVLLREGDTFLELSERTSKINNLNPEMVISLHISANKNTNSNGIDAFVSSKAEFKEKSKVAADLLLAKVSSEKLKKRMVSEAPFYILKHSNCPVVLLELGYLSNESDRNYISSEKGQNEIANKILEAVK
jgi:N-acetylmuramoyl-L-alanine amidase